IKERKRGTDRATGSSHAGKDGMRMYRWLIIVGLFMVVVSGTSGILAAESEAPDAPEQEPQGASGLKILEERLEELEQKQRISDRLRELDQQREEQVAKERPIVGADESGFFLRSANRAFELSFRGYGQVQGRFFLGDTDQLDVN